MRPVGELRPVLMKAAERLAAEHGGASWREIAAAAQVGFEAARITVDNMERAGVLEVVGRDKRAHSRRWVKLYAPRDNFATSATGADLAHVVSCWPRG